MPDSCFPLSVPPSRDGFVQKPGLAMTRFFWKTNTGIDREVIKTLDVPFFVVE